MPARTPWHRHTLHALIALVALPLLLCGVAFAVVLTLGLRPSIERLASWSLDRTVGIGTIKMTWGPSVSIEASNITIANPSWASASAMLTIGHLSAVVDALSLLRGVVCYDKLHIDNAILVLERTAYGNANWKFGDPAEKGLDARTEGGLALVPKNRRQFPSLRNFALTNGHIVFRHPGSREIEIGIGHAKITSPADDAPIEFSVDGDYNGASARLTGFEMGSFNDLRRATIPFKAHMRLVAGAATLTLLGAFEEPVDFEGVTGPMRIDMHSSAGFLKAFGIKQAPRLPLQMTGTFDHTGNVWKLGKLSGRVGDSSFTGQLTLEEGGRAQSDRLHPDIDFTTVNLTSLLGGSDGRGEIGLGVSKSELLVAGEVRARQLHWDKDYFSDVKLQAAITNPEGESINASFGYSGGKGEIKANLTEDASSGHLTGEARLTRVDVMSIMRAAGIDAHAASGRIDLGVSWDMRGATLQRALATARGQVALSTEEAEIPRKLLDKASSDLGAIFHDKTSKIAIKCLLAVGDLQSGILHVRDARLRAGETQLDVHGRVDLLHRRMDVVLQSHSSATLAFDHPLSISGSITQPSIRPSSGGNASPPQFPPIPSWVATNPCSR